MQPSIQKKLLVIIALGSVLALTLIPINGLIAERFENQKRVTRELLATMGGGSEITPPVLTIPFTVGKSRYYGHFFPDHSSATTRLHPIIRYRGIYKVPSYRAEVQVTGRFSPIFKGHLSPGGFTPPIKAHEAKQVCAQSTSALPAKNEPKLKSTTSTRTPSTLGRKPTLPPERLPRDQKSCTMVKQPLPFTIHWDEAFMTFGVGNRTNITPNVALKINGAPVALLEQSPKGTPFDALQGALSLRENAPVTFTYTFELNGAEDLNFLSGPGKSDIRVVSTWRHPSFVGARLPKERTVDDEGFSARWSLWGRFGKTPVRWWAPDGNTRLYKSFKLTSVGVTLLNPVNAYLKSSRATKYAIFLIIGVFGLFLCLELFFRTPIHMIHYLLVGCSLVLYYMVLLSVGEIMGFTFAYITATGIVLLTVPFYASPFVKKRSALIVLIMTLGILYGFFFTLLQFEYYALLMGTAGLTLTLTIAMILTRKIDWYALQIRDAKPASSAPLAPPPTRA